MIPVDEVLVNYGVLGLWTITLLYQQNIFQKKLIRALEDLKTVITQRL